MATALSELFHNPLKSRDDYVSGKISISSNNSSSSKMNNGGYARRPSNGSCSSRPLSTLEDSGNPNNRDVYQRSMQRSDSNRSNTNVNNNNSASDHQQPV